MEGEEMFGFIFKNYVCGRVFRIARIMVFAMSFGIGVFMPRTGMAFDVSIVATVNGNAITSYEFAQRLKLTRKLLEISKINLSDKVVEKNLLKEMIDERLKIAEAQKFSIGVKKDEINEGKGRMEKYLGLGVGEYDKILKELGIEEKFINTKIRADILWMKFVYSVLRGYVKVTDAEVNLFIDNEKQKPHFAYDIVPMIVNDDDKYNKIKTTVKEISDCDEFKEFATQNGDSGSGNMFTIKDKQLDKEMFEPITSTKVGTSIALVRQEGGEGEESSAKRIIFFVCAKHPYVEEFSKDKKEEFRMNIYREKLDSYANKYFNKMRETAVIDVKKDMISD